MNGGLEIESTARLVKGSGLHGYKCMGRLSEGGREGVRERAAIPALGGWM